MLQRVKSANDQRPRRCESPSDVIRFLANQRTRTDLRATGAPVVQVRNVIGLRSLVRFAGKRLKQPENSATQRRQQNVTKCLESALERDRARKYPDLSEYITLLFIHYVPV